MAATNVIDELSSELGLTFERCWHQDRVWGSATALISAGLATFDELPGQPGCGKTMCTYIGKVRLTKGMNLAKRQSPEAYRNIRRLGLDRYCVSLGLSEEESERRYAAARGPAGQAVPCGNQLGSQTLRLLGRLGESTVGTTPAPFPERPSPSLARVIYHPNAAAAPLPRTQRIQGGRWPHGVISISIERQRRRNEASCVASKLVALDLEIAQYESMIPSMRGTLDFVLSELELKRQQRRTLGKRGE